MAFGTCKTCCDPCQASADVESMGNTYIMHGFFGPAVVTDEAKLTKTEYWEYNYGAGAKTVTHTSTYAKGWQGWSESAPFPAFTSVETGSHHPNSNVDHVTTATVTGIDSTWDQTYHADDPDGATSARHNITHSSAYTSGSLLSDVHADFSAAASSDDYFALIDSSGLMAAAVLHRYGQPSAHMRRGRFRLVFPDWSTFVNAKVLATTFSGGISSAAPVKMQVARAVAGPHDSLENYHFGPWTEVAAAQGEQTFFHALQLECPFRGWMAPASSFLFTVCQHRRFLLSIEESAFYYNEEGRKRHDTSSGNATGSATKGLWSLTSTYTYEPEGESAPFTESYSIPYTQADLLADCQAKLALRPYGDVRVVGSTADSNGLGFHGNTNQFLWLQESIYRVGSTPRTPGANATLFRWEEQFYAEDGLANSFTVKTWSATFVKDEAVYSPVFTVAAPAVRGNIYLGNFEQSLDGGATWTSA